tara:strand:- start:799 stop:1041 length:243 start_codon:yes stop_codon:yes gene_type:complete
MVSNIFRHNATITQEKRNNLSQHKSLVVWFTGLSGSGKSTLAHAIVNEAKGGLVGCGNDQHFRYNKKDLLNPWFIVTCYL